MLVVLFFSVVAIYALSLEKSQNLYNNGIIKSLFVLVIPEVLTLLILLILIHTYHSVFKIKTVIISPQSIGFYQLKVLPIFLVAYLIFYPFTFSIRYLIISFPSYSWQQFLSKFQNTYIIESYFLYLPFILVLGYVLINISLTHDYLSQSGSDVIDQIDSINKEEGKEEENADVENNEVAEYISVLKVRSNTGDTFLKVKECYYFETSDHSSLAYHPDGVFKVNKSITNLYKELDPTYFFRNSARFVVNLAYLQSFVYAEKGHYALNFKKPIVANIIVPKYRIEALRMAFQKYHFLTNTDL